MIANISEAKRIVVKVGTSTLAHKTGLMNIQRVERLVKVLADLKNSGKEVILVSPVPSAWEPERPVSNPVPPTFQPSQACSRHRPVRADVLLRINTFGV